MFLFFLTFKALILRALHPSGFLSLWFSVLAALFGLPVRTLLQDSEIPAGCLRNQAPRYQPG